MTGKVSVRLALLAAVAALVAVLVPATLAAGSHGDPPVTAGSESVVFMTFGNGPNDNVTWSGDPDANQHITTKNNDCLAVSFDDPNGSDLLNVAADGGLLGEVKDGLGVKSASDGSGEPCGRVEADDGESLSVTLGSDLGDYLMTAIDVDLELKFNAAVDVSFLHEGTTLKTVSFDGMGSDDGPDSKDGDNYRFLYRPVDGEGNQMYFDEVTFTPTSGAMSLEGGADGTTHDADDHAAFADDPFDVTDTSSQFAVIRAYDGEIDCQDPTDIGSAGEDSTYGTVTMHGQDLNDGEGWAVTDCVLKPFNSATATDAISFVPDDPAGHTSTSARYTLTVTVEDQEVTSSGGTITSLEAVYNLDGSFDFTGATGLSHCQFTPPTDSGDANYNAFWSQDDEVDDGLLTGGTDGSGTNLLPTGHEACWFSASVSDIVTVDGTQYGTEHWEIYLESDPGFSFR